MENERNLQDSDIDPCFHSEDMVVGGKVSEYPLWNQDGPYKLLLATKYQSVQSLFCQERVLLEVSPANVGKPLQHGMIQWIMHWGISLTIVKMHDATTLVVSPLAASADTTRCQGDHHQPPVRCDPATMAVSTFHGVASWKMGNNLEHLKVGTEAWLQNCA